MPPPGGGPMPGGPPMGGGEVEALKKQLQLWLIVGAVAGVIFCCPGVLAAWPGAVLAYMGTQSAEQGNIADAQGKLKTAKLLVIIGLALGVLGWVGFVIRSVLSGF